jgi:beta-glucosidase
MTSRIDSLLAALTLEEKVAMLAGSDLWHAAGVERLGIPALKVSDGPNGARGADLAGGVTSACFPCGTALGATFDLDLIERVGAALGEEARSKGAHVLLAPTLNLHRHPLAGRNFECPSEDPYLAARYAVAYVRGVQSRGVGACIKHFACNDQEHERMTISAEIDERPLRELYLAPFEAAVREADPWAVMSAYNKLHGTYCSEHPWLLGDLLRGEWGFRGLVMSDWFGMHATEAPVLAGLDLEMPGPTRDRGEQLLAALRDGRVDEKALDPLVRRLLELRERAGLFEPGAGVARPERAEDRPEHRALAREAARKSIVLLKNADRALPLDAARLRRVAVIGPNAGVAIVGGGGSSRVAPHYAVSPLAGIRARLAGAAEVVFEPGCHNHRSLPILTGDFSLSLFRGTELAGAPAIRSRARQLELIWLGRFDERIDPLAFSARIEGELEPGDGGECSFGLAVSGRARLLLDGREILSASSDEGRGGAFYGVGTHEKTATATLEPGRRHRLCIEFAKQGEPLLGGVRVAALRALPDDAMARAEAAARGADAAVVVVGLNPDWETEGRDRESLALPGRQDELVERVAAANPRTIVVLNAGSPVATPWLERVRAALVIWYPGQEGGNALADVLFGDADPGGRLPQSWPARIEDSPAHAHYPGADGKVVYGEGLLMGHRGHDASGVAPRFAFGHGLSYTRFRYGGLRARREGDGVVAELDVTNTGERRGEEVVQIYACDLESSVERPPKELAGFARLELAPGEAGTARFALGPRAFSFWDPAARAFRLEPGEFELLAGPASDRILARARLILGR